MGPREPRAQHQPVPEDSLHLHYILLLRSSEYKVIHVSDYQFTLALKRCRLTNTPILSLTFYRRIFPVSEIRIWLYAGYAIVGCYGVITLCITTFQWSVLPVLLVMVRLRTLKSTNTRLLGQRHPFPLPFG